MKFDWMSNKYGGGKYCMLGHGFDLIACYPMVKDELFEGRVLKKTIGRFNTQEEAINKCEEVAIEIIKDLYQTCVVETKDVLVSGDVE